MPVLFLIVSGWIDLVFTAIKNSDKQPSLSQLHLLLFTFIKIVTTFYYDLTIHLNKSDRTRDNQIPDILTIYLNKPVKPGIIKSLKQFNIKLHYLNNSTLFHFIWIKQCITCVVFYSQYINIFQYVLTYSFDNLKNITLSSNCLFDFFVNDLWVRNCR